MAIIVPIVAKFVDEGVKEAVKATKEAETGWQKTGAAMQKMAGPAKVATSAMIGAGYAAAKNAGGALKANKKLAASFTAVGYPENAKAAMEYADSLQHVIGVSDEEIQAVMQKLAAQKDVAASTDLMARATLAAADMSAAGYGTMESAATALGKALQNPAKGMSLLGRMGIQFNETQTETIKKMVEMGDKAGAQALIMKQVESTFSGVAEASASGTAKMKLAWDEVAETIGTSFLPILNKVIEVLGRAAAFMANHTKAVVAFAYAFTGLAAAIVVVSSAMKAWNTIVAAGKAAMAAYKAAVVAAKVATALFAAAQKVAAGATASQASASALAAAGFKAQGIAAKLAAAGTKVLALAMKALRGPIFWIISGVILLATIIIKNWDKIKAATSKVWGWIGGFLSKTWNKIKSMASSIWNAITNVVSKAWNLIKTILKLNPFIIVITHLDKIVGWVKTGFGKVKDIISSAWNAIKGLFKSNPFSAVQGFLNDMWGWFSNTIGKIKDLLDGLLSKAKSIGDSVKGIFNKAKDLASKIPRPGKNAAGGGAGAAAVVTRAVASPYSARMLAGVPVPQTGLVPVRRGDFGGVTIEVNGALDPDAVARQIRRLLENHDVRQGRERGAPRVVAW